jgi:hypothetical protein
MCVNVFQSRDLFEKKPARFEWKLVIETKHGSVPHDSLMLNHEATSRTACKRETTKSHNLHRSTNSTVWA